MRAGFVRRLIAVSARCHAASRRASELSCTAVQHVELRDVRRRAISARRRDLGADPACAVSGCFRGMAHRKGHIQRGDVRLRWCARGWRGRQICVVVFLASRDFPKTQLRDARRLAGRWRVLLGRPELIGVRVFWALVARLHERPHLLLLAQSILLLQLQALLVQLLPLSRQRLDVFLAPPPGFGLGRRGSKVPLALRAIQLVGGGRDSGRDIQEVFAEHSARTRSPLSSPLVPPVRGARLGACCSGWVGQRKGDPIARLQCPPSRQYFRWYRIYDASGSGEPPINRMCAFGWLRTRGGAGVQVACTACAALFLIFLLFPSRSCAR